MKYLAFLILLSSVAVGCGASAEPDDTGPAAAAKSDVKLPEGADVTSTTKPSLANPGGSK